MEKANSQQRVMAATPSSHEQLQEQNRLLRAQVRLLQANCQWLSSCNDTLVDYYSIQGADQHNTTFINPYDSLLQQQGLMPVGNRGTHDSLLNSTFNQAIPATDLGFPNPQTILPCYTGVSTLYNSASHRTSTSNQKPRSRQTTKRPLESSDPLPGDSFNLTTTEQVPRTTESAQFDITDGGLAPWQPDFIGDVDEVPSTPVFNESSTRQSFSCKPNINSESSEFLSSQHTTHPRYETETNSCHLLQQGNLPVTSTPLVDVLPVEASDAVPRNETQAIIPRGALIQQPQWTPDLKHLSTATCTGGYLDQYIYALRDFMQRADAGGSPLPLKQRNKMMAKGVLWVVHEAWPQAEHFWKTTASFQGFLQCEVWRNFPFPSVYQSMHAAYKPTHIQLSIPHSPVIDWLPWPDLRDRIILSQDYIDVDLVCKTAIQNVVAHRRALPQARPQKRVRRDVAGNSRSAPKTSFRVWDLCALEEADGQKPKEGTALSYRPKSASVRALEKAYALECADFETQRLHPNFFTKFPNLWCESVISDYTVQELPSLRNRSDHDMLASSQPISPAAVERLEALGSKMLKVGA